MRRDWGCTYFKLDANFWGAMHGGRFHDAHATRVEAYRRGMDAIRRPVAHHQRDWRTSGDRASARLWIDRFTTGSGVLAPKLCRALLDVCLRKDYAQAEKVRAFFLPSRRLYRTSRLPKKICSGQSPRTC